MTYALRVARDLAASALPAPIARIIALTSPKTLGLSGTPFHEPFHGRRVADYWEALIGVIVDRQGSKAGVGRWGSRLTGAKWAASPSPTVTHCVYRSTRYPPNLSLTLRRRGSLSLPHRRIDLCITEAVRGDRAPGGARTG